MSIRRYFYPIGQGAFYAEKHEDFTIVYDCGNNNATDYGVVKSAFGADEEIDILFVSHLDYDHISKIGQLKNSVKSIKNVVLPLLHEDEKKLLVAFNDIHDFSNVNDIVKDPKSFFGNKTKIWMVDAGDGEENVNEEGEITYLNEKTIDSDLSSGTKIGIDKSSGWVFIPYNYKHKERSEQLKDKLKKAGFDVQRLKNDSNYVNDIIADKKEVKKLKDVYKSIDGDINENSLILYSGPNECNCDGIGKGMLYSHRNCIGFPISSHYFKHSRFYRKEKVACIYTGDSDFNKISIKEIYGNYMENVGTIQVPHHGSKRSWSKSSLNFSCREIVFPISAGKNPYGHPSYDVIGDIVCKGGIPIVVSECNDSLFMEGICILK